MKELELFLGHMKQRNLSKHTIESYLLDLNQFLSSTEKDIKNITKADIRDYLNKLKDSGISTSSISRKLSAIKGLFKFCATEDIIDISPAQLLESPKQIKRLPTIVDTNSIQTVLTNTYNLRDKALIELLMATGIRRSEVIALKRTDIDFTRNIILVLGKGNKQRLVPCHPNSLKVVREWLESHDSNWVFPSIKSKGKHIAPRTVNDIVKKNSNGTINVTPHKFRHALGTSLFEKGADIKVIQDILGHSSIDTTNIYARVSVDRNVKEYMKCYTV